MSRAMLAAALVASAAPTVSGKGAAAECVAEAIAPSCSGGQVTVNLNPFKSSGFDTASWTTSQGGVDPKNNQITFALSASTCNVQETATLTLADAEGSTLASCATSYVFQHTEAPSFTSKDLPADTTVESGDLGVGATLTAIDACSQPAAITYVEDQSGVEKGVGKVVRTWTAADVCGNEAKHSQTITLQDTTAPEFKGVDSDTDASCDNVPAPCEPTAVDASQQGDLLVELDETRTAIVCANTYQLVRTWTASDGNGQTATSTQTVNVSDSEAPSFDVTPENSLTSSCDGIPAAPEVTATDNCDNAVSVNYKTERANGSCAHNYDLIRTWTAQDTCGNANTQTQTVQVRDTTPPVLSGVPADTTTSCGHGVPCVVTASDSCDSFVPVSFGSEEISRTCADTWTDVLTWTATDECGNSVSESQTVTIVDDQTPAFVTDPFTFADGLTVPATCEALNITADATDNCRDPEVLHSEVEENRTGPNNYDVVHTWTATDLCGHAATLSMTVEVRDSEGPTLVGLPPDTSAYNCLVAPAPTVEALDNCCNATVAELSETVLPGNCTDEYRVVRSWSASDCNGNSDPVASFGQQTITVADNTPPTCPGVPSGSTTYGCTLPPAPTVVCGDNCDETVEAPEFSEEVTSATGACVTTVERNWFVTDRCGNTASWQHLLSHTDEDKPTLVGVPQDMDVECDSVPSAPNVTYTDECGLTGTADFSEERVDGSCADTYDLVWSWSATDACGQTATASVTVAVADSQGPAWPSSGYAAVDNCDPNPDVSSSEVTVPGCDESYTTTTTYSTVDRCGNNGTVVAVPYHYNDETPPTITCTANCGGAYDCAETVGAPVLVTDGADAAGAVCDPPEDSEGCGWQQVYTCRAKDECGNEEVFTVTNTFSDSTAPTITVDADVTIDCSESFPLPTNMTLGASDDCDKTVVVATQLDPEYVNVYPQSVKVTWTASDACGNSVTDSRTWTKEDTTPPEMTCPADATIECDQVVSGEAVVTDDCDTDVQVSFDEQEEGTDPTCELAGRFIRTWTAQDHAGNTNSCAQTVIVDDTTPPTLEDDSDIQDVTISCDEEEGDPSLAYTDNCALTVANTTAKVTTKSINAPNGTDYTQVRTFTGTDTCGNFVKHTQTITSLDTVPPTITVPDDKTINCTVTPNWADPKVDDDCSTPVTTSSTSKFSDCEDQYTLVRTWDVVDAEGNKVTGEATISVVDHASFLQVSTSNEPAGDMDYYVGIVNDITAPSVTAFHPCDDAVVVPTQSREELCEDGFKVTWHFDISTDCQSTVRTYTQTVNDKRCAVATAPADLDLDCSDPSTDYDSCLPSSNNCKAECKKTYTATNECGCTDYADQTITFTDTTPPTIVVDPGYTFKCDEPVDITATTTDDCNNDPSTAIAGPTLDEDKDTDDDEATSVYCFSGATDLCGNVAAEVCTTVTTVKSCAPAITAPADDTVDYEDEDGDDAHDGVPPCDVTLASATGCCGFTVTCSQTGSGQCEGGFYVNEFVVTDNYGQTATDYQTITVMDNEGPKLHGVPGDVTRTVEEVTSNDEEELAGDSHTGYPLPTVYYTDANQAGVDSDLVISFSETIINADGNDGNAYQIIRSWSVTDTYGCGSDTLHQTITVTDDVPPLIEGVPPHYYLDCADASEAAIATYVDAITANVTANLNSGEAGDQDWTLDAASPSKSVVAPAPGGASCSDFTEVYTWTVRDTAGNTVEATLSVVVTDTTDPEIEVDAHDGTQECSLEDPTATVSDDCAPESQLDMSVTSYTIPEVPEAGADYTAKYTWTATDGCGGTHTAYASVEVKDTTPPTFNGVPDFEHVITGLACGGTPDIPDPTADDDCSSATVSGPLKTNEVDDCDKLSYTLTWTATDVQGNTATLVQTVSAARGPYTITWDQPLPQDQLDVEGCGLPAAPAAPTATASCPGDLVSVTPGHSGPANQTQTYSWTASTSANSCYSPITHSATHSWQDTTPPVITPPGDDTDECTARSETDLTASDACGDVPAHESRTEEGSCPTTVYRTWTATDVNGNTAVETATLIVEDTTPPFFLHNGVKVTSLPDVQTAERCNGGFPFAVVTASDDCDATITTPTPSEGDSGTDCDAITTATWTATDVCGNTAQISQDALVTDSTPPTVDYDADGTYVCTGDPSQPRLDATDCSLIASELTSHADGTDGCNKVRTYTTIVTDNCGHTSGVITQTSTSYDDAKPTLEGAQGAVGGCDEPTVTAPVGKDNCGSATVTNTTHMENSSCKTKVKQYTFVATDECGKTSAPLTVNATWGDDTAPEFSGSLADLSDPCVLDATKWDSPKASDNCGSEGLNYTYSDAQTGQNCSVVVTRTHTVRDECGNQDTISQEYTIKDDQQPVWSSSVGKNQDFTCEGTPVAPTANDECAGNTVVTADPDNVLVAKHDCSNPDVLYQYERTYRTQDNCGNKNEWSATITIKDEEAPALTMLCDGAPCEDATLEVCTDFAPKVTCTATDNCGSVTPSLTTNYTYGCDGTVLTSETWTCEAAYNCKSAQSDTVTFTWADTTPPALSTVSDVTKKCTWVATTPTATESCATGNPNLSVQTSTAVIEAAVGECADSITEYTYSAQDICGNLASNQRTVTISDTVPPVIVLDDNAKVNAVECSVSESDWSSATATDNCLDNVGLTWSDSPVSDACGGDVVRTFVATDSCGNTAEKEDLIVVDDTTPPTWDSEPSDCDTQCPELEDTECPVPTVSAQDNCGAVFVTQGDDVVVDADTTVRTWTAEDNCGNAIATEQTIVIADTTPPSLSVTRGDDTVGCDAVPVLYDGIATADDNCGTASVTCSEELVAGACDHDYSLVRTCTASDPSGNTATNTHTVTVEDTTPPDITGPADSTREFCDPEAPVEVTASDNCDGFVQANLESESTTTANCASNFSVTRVWSAEDSCGNKATLEATETVEDLTPPVLSHEAEDAEVECDSVPDACDVKLLSDCHGNPEGTQVSYSEVKTGSTTGLITRTWSATDACGNLVEHTQTLTVRDTSPPLLSRTPEDEVVSCDCDTLPGVVTVHAIDNCDETIVAQQTSVKVASDDASVSLYTLTRTWTATDTSGNSVSHTQTVQVTDSEAPQIAGGVPETSSVACDSVPDGDSKYSSLVRDNCDETPAYSYSGGAAVSCGNSRELTWTVSDQSGNTKTYTQTETVTGTAGPVVVSAPTCAAAAGAALGGDLFVLQDACSQASLVGIVCNSTDTGAGDCTFDANTLTVGASAAGTAFDVYITGKDDCGTNAVTKRTLHVQDQC